MRKFLPPLSWCIAAVALALASLVMVSFGPNYTDPASREGLFYTWFYLVPLIADSWVEPQSGLLILAVSTTAYSLQYLATIAMASFSWKLSTVIIDFVGPPKHRGTLAGRRV
jgi:hypothetical protein